MKNDRINAQSVEWRPIKGYEGFYEISSLGEVRSIDRTIMTKSGQEQHWPSRVKKQYRLNDGSLYVNLYKNGTRKNFLVSLLCATNFGLENPDEAIYVRHKDGDVLNNSIDNLVYGSYARGREKKPVLQYDREGNFLAEFPSASDAAKSIGRNVVHIIACCNGAKNQPTAYGYIWKYKGSDKVIVPCSNKVYQYTMDGKLVGIFNNIKEAAGVTGIWCFNISNCLKGKRKSAGGYVWRRDLVKQQKKRGRPKKNEEIWRPVKGYEGMYEVSSYGRVRSLPSTFERHGRVVEVGEKILKITDVGNRMVVVLRKKTFQLHRLVAETFIDNPEGLKWITHIDGNYQNNRVDNLAWCL